MTIKLEQVIEAIEMSDDFFTSFWDTKTGETVYLADPLLNGETDEVLTAEIENDPKRFLRFPTKYEIHECRIMEDFIEQLSPGKVQSDLSYSIRGKGAFRRFKESIRYHGLEQQWYDYLEKAYRDIAVRWCTEEGLLEVKQQIEKALRQYKNPPIPTKQEQIVVPNNSVLVLVKAS